VTQIYEIRSEIFRRDFGHCRDLIANIYGTQQRNVNRKTTLQTTDTSAQAQLTWCILVHKRLKIRPEFWSTQRAPALITLSSLFRPFIFSAQGTQFPRAVNIKKKMKHAWKGHGADSEIGNVSARQAALNRWTSTDKRWKKWFLEGQSSPQSNAFLFASGQAPLKLRPNGAIQIYYYYYLLLLLLGTPELWHSCGQEFPGAL